MRRQDSLFLIAIALALGAAAAAQAELITTTFTGIQDGVDLSPPPGPPPTPVPPGSIVNTPHPPFTLGMPPFTATFGGEGFAFHVGIPAMYAFTDGGRNFWGVRGDGLGAHTGVITFSTPAASVNLLARGTPDGLFSPPPFFGTLGEANGLVRAFAPDGSLLGEVSLRNDLPVGFPTDRSNMQEIEFLGPVGRVELVNSGAANSFAVIAGLTAGTIPEPSSLVLVGVAGAALACYAWRRRK